ncbi:hypothetical protein HDU81_008157, partial [Chytriomyces hyalinus]
ANDLATAQANEAAVENVETRFENTELVKMTPQHLCDWLHGLPNVSTADLAASVTNSTADASASEVASQKEVNANSTTAFPLVGREESILHIAECFARTNEHRSNLDRNMRPIPVCTGVPGLGKNRLTQECLSTVMTKAGIPGKCLSVIISFGTDGNHCKWVDDRLGIQCSFAWHVLHAIFKAHKNFGNWMLKSPSNRSELTLDLALATIEHCWRQKTSENILVFVGVDEYQILGQEKLTELLDSLCNSSCVAASSRLTLFTMLAGTDLNMMRVAQLSHPNTERIPIRFLTHVEAMKAIGPFISNIHKDFVVSGAFAQNVFYLGGVPRLLTKFAMRVVKMPIDNLVPNRLREARTAVLRDLQYPQLSISDILKLLATSFTNTSVENPSLSPFSESLLPSDERLTWSQMVSIGLCLIQDDGRVIVSFHLVPQVLARQGREGGGLDEYELALLESLKHLSENVEVPHANLPACLSWESFGAHFYCIRINSFLVLGHKEVLVCDLLRGTQYSSEVFRTNVHIRVAKVCHSSVPYGPAIPKVISQTGAGNGSVDWIDGEALLLSGESGPGVDIFFALKPEEDAGYVVVLDQRKRLRSDITQSGFLQYTSKIPDKPKFMNNVETVVGLMSVFSDIKMTKIPDSMFFSGRSDSPYFHGSLSDHPGCSVDIDVNTGLETAIQQLFSGSQKKRKEWADGIVTYRSKRGRIDSVEHFLTVASELGGTVDESAHGRMRF